MGRVETSLQENKACQCNTGKIDTNKIIMSTIQQKFSIDKGLSQATQRAVQDFPSGATSYPPSQESTNFV